MAASNPDFLLDSYRVLDLTDERGLICGKILGDLGADVIQVEPPGGSTARQIGPYHRDQVHREKSLFWWAYAANKRGITLDIHTSDGRHMLKSLLKDAQFLIESFSPGYLGTLGLGYDNLAAINPGLVMVSITPFGQDGPYAHYRATDIVGMAMGGFMYLTGDSDRPPLRVSFPHFYLHGGAAGAMGALLAHTHRTATGEGQHVDVSCQQAVAKTLAHAPQNWDVEKVILKRQGPYRQTGSDTHVRINWPCKDGYVNFMPQGGSIAGSTRALLAWMDEEGLGDDYLGQVNWEELGYGEVKAEVMERCVAPLERFFVAHTRAELTAGSLERRILMFPVATPSDIMSHPQLEARDYFQELPHPELDAPVTYEGAFVKTNGAQRVGIRRRAPLIGEHNREIYVDELGLSHNDLATLRRGGAV